jgi:hypothetical protein
MGSADRSSTKITKEALERLAPLSAAVQRDFGVPASHEAIVSALVLEITVPQLAGILLGYHKRIAPSPADEDEQPT